MLNIIITLAMKAEIIDRKQKLQHKLQHKLLQPQYTTKLLQNANTATCFS
jgi:hypothetical protein